MSTSVIEPGTRLAGRYRLEERVRESGGSTLWRAIDEILARAVAVRTFTPGFPRVAAVVTAARSASRLTDPRLTQVFDADDSGELAYVVSEWVTGETLEAMVSADGPMEAGRAATLLYEAAQALNAAHSAGLVHLRLTPRDLLWTTGNTVKILGVAVDAALAGTTVGDPARADVQGLGRLLYTALTGRWPETDGPEGAGNERGRLPAAPENNGVLCNPRQIVPGIPQQLDTITCRALGQRTTDGQEPLTSPAALAEALARVPRVPLPLFAGLPHGPSSVVPRPAPSAATGPRHAASTVPAPARHASGAPGVPSGANTPAPPHQQRHQQPPQQPQQQQSYRPRHPQHQDLPNGPDRTRSFTGPYADVPHGSRQPTGHGRGTNARRPLIAAAVGLAALIIGIGGWQLMSGGDSPARGPAPSTSTGSTPPQRQADARLNPVSAEGFDPTGPDHPDGAVSRGAQAVIGGGSSTVWHSQRYQTANFGSYKTGIGLLIDMGNSAQISKVSVNVPASTPGAMELRVGEEKSLSALQPVGRTNAAAGQFDISAAQGSRGRYVLLWFTKLPMSSSEYRAQISGVTVYGRQG